VDGGEAGEGWVAGEVFEGEEGAETEGEGGGFAG
jgi:hypothetical protein